jgi:hypothetical protein
LRILGSLAPSTKESSMATALVIGPVTEWTRMCNRKRMHIRDNPCPKEVPLARRRAGRGWAWGGDRGPGGCCGPQRRGLGGGDLDLSRLQIEQQNEANGPPRKRKRKRGAGGAGSRQEPGARSQEQPAVAVGSRQSVRSSQRSQSVNTNTRHQQPAVNSQPEKREKRREEGGGRRRRRRGGGGPAGGWRLVAAGGWWPLVVGGGGAGGGGRSGRCEKVLLRAAAVRERGACLRN